MFSSVPLEFLVSFVANNRGSAPGQAFLGDIYMVALHPLRPVTTVTAMDESGTFKEKGGPGHNWSLLEEPENRKDFMTFEDVKQPEVRGLH